MVVNLVANLTKYEQETIINYNNEEKTASIFTYDKSLIRKLDKRLSEYPDIKVVPILEKGFLPVKIFLENKTDEVSKKVNYRSRFQRPEIQT